MYLRRASPLRMQIGKILPINTAQKESMRIRFLFLRILRSMA